MVDRVGGALSGLTPAIQGFGCEVARAAEARAAVALAGSIRRLSLVAVNGDVVVNDAGWLVSSIKTQHPDLPILWYCADPKAVTAPAQKLELVSNDLKRLEARISALLRQEFYSPAFIQQVVSGVRAVLVDFAIDAQPSEPSIKSSLTTLSEVNAYLPFSGRRLTGHIVLSASQGDLTAAYRSKFPRVKFPGMDDLEDLLGEIANQVVGHVKRSLAPDGADDRMGLPHFVRGEGASIRHKAGAPSLSVEFTGPAQKLSVELCVHRFDGAAVSGAAGEEQLKPGVIHYL